VNKGLNTSDIEDMASLGGTPEEKPKFKSIKKKRPLRTRRDSDEDDNEANNEEKQDSESVLQDTLELQKLRKRPKGVNVAALALGKKVTKTDSEGDNDPFKIKTVGLLTLEEAKRASQQELANDGNGTVDGSDIGTQFSKETRVRDEDEEMRRFIEIEMEKRRMKGSRGRDANETGETESTYLSPEDAALASLPAHLKSSHTKKNEEMLSSQMLSGIPEVDLGIDEKIRNIEATEAAKKRAAEERIRKAKSGTPSEFVPTNLAVNFRQANRFKQTEEQTDEQTNKQTDRQKKNKQKKGEEKLVTQRTVVVGQVPQERLVAVDSNGQPVTHSDPNRATDDHHLTQFKKHFQRK